MDQLLLIALSTLVSEDLALIGAGVLIAQGQLAWIPGLLACAAGIAAGDILLLLAGRVGGRTLLAWRPVRRLIPTRQLERASRWIGDRGLAVVLLSRFTPGLRLPTYFMAGALNVRVWAFCAYFVVAAVLWTPLLVGGSAVLGGAIFRNLLARSTNTIVEFLIAFAIAGGLWQIVRSSRFAAFCYRLAHWEFWPRWAVYMPLVPYLMWLALKHRSLTLFTAANPGIPTGGVAGESKSDILAHLSRGAGEFVARYQLLRRSFPLEERVAQLFEFMSRLGLNFPIVLKPDVGERGTGVAIVRSESEMREYLRSSSYDVIVQEYVAGIEFGIFYRRDPAAANGRVTSITKKVFPNVTGDGVSTVRELITRDSRAFCMADVYLAALRTPGDYVPVLGEPVQLVELGSHCRGAIFLDGTSSATAALESSIDRIAKAHPGFYIGRFDLRVPSLEALQAGRDLKIVELNGVGAEPAHIYDPAVSLVEAYATLARHWRSAWEIGSHNRMRGARPDSVRELLSRITSRPHARQEPGRPAAYSESLQFSSPAVLSPRPMSSTSYAHRRRLGQ